MARAGHSDPSVEYVTDVSAAGVYEMSIELRNCGLVDLRCFSTRAERSLVNRTEAVRHSY